jgi:hypothetical protein
VLVSADDVAATLKLVIPGFIALSVFYWFGLAVKRTDWRWTLWSLLASIPLTFIATGITAWVAGVVGAKTSDLAAVAATCSADGIGAGDSADAIKGTVKECVTSAAADRYLNLDLLLAIALAVVAGLIAAWVWKRAAERVPELRRRTEPLAWGSVLRTPQWVQVETEKASYIGWVRELADPVVEDADTLDIYLTYPKKVTGPGKNEDLNVEGLLLARGDIKSVLVLKTTPKPEATN